MNADRRRHPRIPMEVEVEFHCPGGEMRVVRTRDLSGGGVLLVISETERPPLGAQVQVRVVGTLGDEGETPPLVAGRVVRHLPEGVAVEFVDT
jgi:c-di-GMP-binding flagellar brake protein YcgR